MANPIKRRLPELSIMNILLCLMVIFIHVSSTAVTTYPAGSLPHTLVFIPWWLCSVAVYGFIFLSGLKLCLPSQKPFHLGKFYLGRLRSILLPYFLWVIIYFFFFGLAGSLPLTPQRFLDALCTGNIAGHLYFIIAILQFYLLAPLWKWCVRAIHPAIALPIATFLMMLFRMHLPYLLQLLKLERFILTDRFFPVYLLFWLGGCYAGAYYEKFKSGLLSHAKLLTGAFLFFTALDLVVGIFNTAGILYLPIHEESHMLFFIFSILFLLMIGEKLGQKGLMERRGLALLDRSSFAIYLSHILILEGIAAPLVRLLTIQSTALALCLRAAVTFGLTLALCMGYTAVKTHILKKRG